MSKTGDQKPVYLIAILDDFDGKVERWLTTTAEEPVDRVAVAFGTEEEAEAYVRRHVNEALVYEIMEFARVPEPSEE